MLGSQAIETAIGLAVMFFILATAASTITESVSRFFRKRAKDFKVTLKEMLTERSKEEGRESRETRNNRLSRSDGFFDLFEGTSVWQAAEAASGRTFLLRRRVGNSYLSAKSFADAVGEVLASDQARDMLANVPSLKRRLDALVEESKRGMLDVKAGLESWFDETMSRAEAAYKRWAALVLFVVGLGVAVLGNASTTNVASDLWTNAATRAAVAEAAGNLGEDPDDLASVAAATDRLIELHLPVGWDLSGSDDKKTEEGVVTDTLANNGLRDFISNSEPWAAFYRMLGWVLTALLLMLGAPFWFDLLTRLVAIRSTGTKPPPAAADEPSATRATARVEAAEPNAGSPAGPESDPAFNRLLTVLDKPPRPAVQRAVGAPTQAQKTSRWAWRFR